MYKKYFFITTKKPKYIIVVQLDRRNFKNQTSKTGQWKSLKYKKAKYFENCYKIYLRPSHESFSLYITIGLVHNYFTAFFILQKFV